MKDLPEIAGMMKNAFAASTLALASGGTVSIRPLILLNADISAWGFFVIRALPRSAANSRYLDSARMSNVLTAYTTIETIQIHGRVLLRAHPYLKDA